MRTRCRRSRRTEAGREAARRRPAGAVPALALLLAGLRAGAPETAASRAAGGGARGGGGGADDGGGGAANDGAPNSWLPGSRAASSALRAVKRQCAALRERAADAWVDFVSPRVVEDASKEIAEKLTAVAASVGEDPYDAWRPGRACPEALYSYLHWCDLAASTVGEARAPVPPPLVRRELAKELAARSGLGVVRRPATGISVDAGIAAAAMALAALSSDHLRPAEPPARPRTLYVSAPDAAAWAADDALRPIFRLNCDLLQMGAGQAGGKFGGEAGGKVGGEAGGGRDGSRIDGASNSVSASDRNTGSVSVPHASAIPPKLFKTSLLRHYCDRLKLWAFRPRNLLEVDLARRVVKTVLLTRVIGGASGSASEGAPTLGIHILPSAFGELPLDEQPLWVLFTADPFAAQRLNHALDTEVTLFQAEPLHATPPGCTCRNGRGPAFRDAVDSPKPLPVAQGCRSP